VCLAFEGAIVGLAALGPRTVRLLLLPHLAPYLEQLQPLLGIQVCKPDPKSQQAGSAESMLQRLSGQQSAGSQSSAPSTFGIGYNAWGCMEPNVPIDITHVHGFARMSEKGQGSVITPGPASNRCCTATYAAPSATNPA